MKCQHPEHGNFGVIPTGSTPTVERGADVVAHRAEPQWFVGKHVKVGFFVSVVEREYMWVKVEEAMSMGEAQVAIIGHLTNTPIRAHQYTHGCRVTCTVDEIIDVCG